MDAEQLVSALRAEVFEQASTGTIDNMIKPPGRAPLPTLIKASAWYRGLDDRDAAYVGWVARHAAYAAIFDVLAVLDGVKVIDNEHGDLVLTYERVGAEPVRLNRPEVKELHSLWTDEVFPYTESLPD